MAMRPDKKNVPNLLGIIELLICRNCMSFLKIFFEVKDFPSKMPKADKKQLLFAGMCFKISYIGKYLPNRFI